MFNLLSASVQVNIFSGFGSIQLDWIGNIIKSLIEGVGSIGVGIIVFTLILKLITLPFDIMSRVSNKKNSLKMKRMRPQLEKLQRQYANDKELYNQKMRALYKKEGYSMFSTCLPTIITMVIFILVIGQFSAYSRYANLSLINSLSNAYTDAVVKYAEDNSEYFTINYTTDDNGNKKVSTLFVNDKLLGSEYCDDLNGIVRTDKINVKANSLAALKTLVASYNEKGYVDYQADKIFVETDGNVTFNFDTTSDGFDKDGKKSELRQKIALLLGVAESDIPLEVLTDQAVDNYLNTVVSESLVCFAYDKQVENFSGDLDDIDPQVYAEKCADIKDGGMDMTVQSVYKTSDIDTLARLTESKNQDGFTGYIASQKFTLVEETQKYVVRFDGENSWSKSDLAREVKAQALKIYAIDASRLDQVNVSDQTIETRINEKMTEAILSYEMNNFVDSIIKPIGRNAAKEAFYTDTYKSREFLWVKNLWVPDLPWRNPVYTSLDKYDFYNQLDEGNKAKTAEFAEITAGLEEEKTQPNGYLILVVLSIGIMLLSQLIANRAQKDQLELQSVDGGAAQSSKMMMWMMPIMFGFFAFIYTASFSIYMIVSSATSVLSTLIINFFVERSFNKQMEQEEMENDKRFKPTENQGPNKNKKRK